MSRVLQDQFIDDDDEEEVCPLCVEELDLTDKGFKPCPCGYQICQFCYNNIKTTMNGLCPACRRQYDEKNIQWKVVSPEEMAQHRQNLAQQAKKKAAAKQKEAQKREADHLSRKHLAGLRVRQKNLVYVTGLKPKVTGDKLVEALRSKEFFGQYGDIFKVVVSKTKDQTHAQAPPIGIYVTFARKEDAALCIATIDGHKQPDGNRVRAQYGTTKYCSAYLRGDQCTNRNCMFLHEPGEDSESFTRQDLSSLNASSSQHMGPGLISHSPQPQPFVQPVPLLPVQDSEVIASSPTDDVPALPATASWGDQARQLSRTTTDSAASPQVSNPLPAAVENKEEVLEPAESAEPSSATAQSSSSILRRVKKDKPRYPYFEDLPKKAFDPTIKYTFGFPSNFSEKDKWIVENFPPLFDLRQKPRHGLMKRQAELQRDLLQQQGMSPQALESKPESIGDVDESADHAPPGSSQLGGEPEERPDHTQLFNALGGLGQQQAIGSHALGHGLNEELSSLGNRGISQQPTAQQQLLLQQLKMGNIPTGNHGRQPSRFFLNEVMGAAANKSLAKQQANFGQQQYAVGNQGFPFTSAQGPPPGLKTTGTPPVTGGGMFAQGHGFTQGFIRDNEKYWDSGHRGGGGRGGPEGSATASSKRELMFSPSYQYSPSTGASGPTGLPQGVLAGFPYGGGYQENNNVIGNAMNLAGGGGGGPQQSSSQSQKQQKKKGKKHRHANTSSSGGGGGASASAVDVGDPSILQMRLAGGAGGPNAAAALFGAGSAGGPAGGAGAGGFSSALHANAYGRW